jgi:hypothetical protein
MPHPAQPVVPAALLGIALGACATYQPPKLPARQLAVVLPSEQSTEERLYIDGVDGLAVSAGSAVNFHTDDNGVYLMPGRHTLNVRLRFGTTDTGMKVRLLVEAGRSYRVESLENAYGFGARVVDTATGAVVGGTPEKR